jgi:hypothetical protein
MCGIADQWELEPPATCTHRAVKTFFRGFRALFFLGDEGAAWTAARAYYCASMDCWEFFRDAYRRDRCALFLAEAIPGASDYAAVYVDPGRRLWTRRDKLRAQNRAWDHVGPRTRRILDGFPPAFGLFYDGACAEARAAGNSAKELLARIQAVDTVFFGLQSTRDEVRVGELIRELAISLDALSVEFMQLPAPENGPLLASADLRMLMRPRMKVTDSALRKAASAGHIASETRGGRKLYSLRDAMTYWRDRFPTSAAGPDGN